MATSINMESTTIKAVPTNTFLNKHKRASSTGTTGDESYYTTDDDDLEELEVSLKNSYEHVNIVCNGMFFDDSVVNKGDVKVSESKDKISWESLSETSQDNNEKESDLVKRLQSELESVRKELKSRDEEIERLTRIRTDVETELEDLTASLFQEAHTMVQNANVNQAAAENSLKESEMKVEVLTAEVSALKTLVLTSTPSCPNPHLHPQISSRNKDDYGGVFTRKHQRSPSHFNLKYGREGSPPDSPIKETRGTCSLGCMEPVECKEGYEVDPNIHKEFLAWKQSAKMDKNDEFLARVYREDINLCLDFNNKELEAKLVEAIDSGNIFVEAVGDKSKTLFPKKCALLEVPRLCNYRMKLGEQETWHNISQICRNRIIAVCDFLNYLRYIERGLVKNSAHDVYWEMTRLRKEMVLARLGLPLSNMQY